MTTNVMISSDQLKANISTLGAELQSLTTSGGHELQWDGDPAIWRGRAPILFPVIGLLENGQYRLARHSYNMPKHGFARHSEFDIVSRAADAVTLRLSASPATRPIYPFEFQLDIDFRIVGPTLMLSATIVDHGVDPMPASFGFHPAFRWPLPFDQPREDHYIRFQNPEPAPVRRIDADGFLKPDPVPTPVVGDMLRLDDALFVDDAVIFDRLSSRNVCYGASDGPRLHVSFEDFPTLGVWTKPGADFICIEPWQGVSDPVGFTGDIWAKPGIFAVAPGQARSMAMHVSLEA